MRQTLFLRLLVMVCGVAAAATAVALILQDRALSRDLRTAAEGRLARTAEAAEQLMQNHLEALEERYAAISGTPQFRAALEVGHAPTLEHHARMLAERQHALRILFLDAEDRLVAAAGDPGADADAMAVRGAALVAHGDRPVAVVSTPLETAGRSLGRLVAVQPIERERIDEWSALCGGRVLFAAEPPARDASRIALAAADLGGLRMYVVASTEAERAALARSRGNLLLAGAIAIGVAFAASLLLSRGLLRPVLELKEAARRLGEGDLTVRVHGDRTDEIGDLARAFESMAASLRQMIGRLAHTADGVETAAVGVTGEIDRLVAVTAEQVESNERLTDSMRRINGEVQGIAESAGDSARLLEAAVHGSSISFRELRESGDHLNENATSLTSRLEEIARSIDGIAKTAEHVATTTEGVIASAQQTSQSMEEMAASTRDVNANAGETARLSTLVVDHAEKGHQRVALTIEAMNSIGEATGEAEGVVRGLEERAREIGKIVGVIDEVTDQTSLLALNASIIAARAGEHGRAFDVVAGEMNALAERVLASTREIDQLVGAVQEHATRAMASIEAGSTRVRQGVELAEETREALGRIRRAARESGAHMAHIEAATGEQSRAAGQVSAEMTRVQEGIERIRSADRAQREEIDGVQGSSALLHEIARKVRESIERQARGISRIGSAIETVQQSVNRSNGALQEQAAACGRAADFLDSAREHTNSNEESARRMGAAMRALVEQAEALREDVRRFRV